MSNLTIRSNYHRITLLSGYELSAAERKELDYIGDPADVSENSPWNDCISRFFRYRGNIYDINEFTRITTYANHSGWSHPSDNPALLKWDAISSDSFFSGIVFKFVDNDSGDYDTIIVGTYCC